MDVIAFARGVPAPEMLPVRELHASMQRAFERSPIEILSYGGGGGWPPLRSMIARNHRVDDDRVVVTTGSLQGFVLVAETLARRARRAGRTPRIVVENPTYDRPLVVLERLGVRVDYAATDSEGLVVDDVRRCLEDGPIDLLYTIPSFQNPGGTTMSDARRDELITLATSEGFTVYEDDPYGLLSFGDPPPTSLFDRSPDGTVIYSGSFSKTIAPGLRVGWLVLGDEIAGDITRIANDTYISPGHLGQATVYEFLESGAFLPNVERCRVHLERRCDALCDALSTHLPDATWTRPGGGYFLWLGLPEGADAATVARMGVDRCVTVVPGSAFGPGNEGAVRLAFSSPPFDAIHEGTRRLAGAIQLAERELASTST